MRGMVVRLIGYDLYHSRFMKNASVDGLTKLKTRELNVVNSLPCLGSWHTCSFEVGFPERRLTLLIMMVTCRCCRTARYNKGDFSSHYVLGLTSITLVHVVKAAHVHKMVDSKTLLHDEGDGFSSDTRPIPLTNLTGRLVFLEAGFFLGSLHLVANRNFPLISETK